MEKLINCRECGKEISRKTPTCPSCGEKQTNGHLILGFIMVVIIIVSVVGVIGAREYKSSPAISTQGAVNGYQSLEQQYEPIK